MESTAGEYHAVTSNWLDMLITSQLNAWSRTAGGMASWPLSAKATKTAESMQAKSGAGELRRKHIAAVAIHAIATTGATKRHGLAM